jgi:hypothetical protein
LQVLLSGVLPGFHSEDQGQIFSSFRQEEVERQPFLKACPQEKTVLPGPKIPAGILLAPHYVGEG